MARTVLGWNFSAHFEDTGVYHMIPKFSLEYVECVPMLRAITIYQHSLCMYRGSEDISDFYLPAQLLLRGVTGGSITYIISPPMSWHEPVMTSLL